MTTLAKSQMWDSKCKSELSTSYGQAIYEGHFVIPSGLRQIVKNIFHKGHRVINKMTRLANIWWPKTKLDVRKKSRNCIAFKMSVGNSKSDTEKKLLTKIVKSN